MWLGGVLKRTTPTYSILGEKAPSEILFQDTVQSLLPHTFQYNPTSQHFQFILQNYYISSFMVKTRSQTLRSIQIEPNEMNRHGDSESESSIPEVLTREQLSEFNDGDVLNYQINSGRDTVNQRFSDMNRQINELTNLILALTEKISSSNRERNDLNTVSNGHEARSDNVFDYWITRNWTIDDSMFALCSSIKCLLALNFSILLLFNIFYFLPYREQFLKDHFSTS